MAEQGFLNERMVSDMWRQHLLGQFDRSQYLWNVLMFQAWFESIHSPRDAQLVRNDQVTA